MEALAAMGVTEERERRDLELSILMVATVVSGEYYFKVSPYRKRNV